MLFDIQIFLKMSSDTLDLKLNVNGIRQTYTLAGPQKIRHMTPSNNQMLQNETIFGFIQCRTTHSHDSSYCS